MGSHVHKRAVAVAGDASRLDAKNNTFFHEIQEYEGIEFRTQRRYTRKKENSKLSSLLTLSSRASTRMIAEKLDSHLTLINSGILVKEFGGESGVNINVSGFPYYRSWCSDRCQDAVLVKDACVSCTIIPSNSDNTTNKRNKSGNPSLERKLITQLKTEYKDLSTITRKISAYTKDIITSLSIKNKRKSSSCESACENNADEDDEMEAMAIEYFDKSGQPCLKLRLIRSSKDLSEDNQKSKYNHGLSSDSDIAEQESSFTEKNKGLLQRIFTDRFRSVDETSSNCNNSTIYSYLMFSRRTGLGQSKDKSNTINSC